jgi:hypothetical protein
MLLKVQGEAGVFKQDNGLLSCTNVGTCPQDVTSSFFGPKKTPSPSERDGARKVGLCGLHVGLSQPNGDAFQQLLQGKELVNLCIPEQPLNLLLDLH